MTFPSDRIRYLDPHGDLVDAKIIELSADDLPARQPLTSARVRLDVDGAQFDARYLGATGSVEGYEQLDNEILAGLRITRLYAPTTHPPDIPRFIGRYVDASESFALQEPPSGGPIGRLAGTMLSRDVRTFQRHLLRAVLVTGSAGIAHRGISPDTVLWDPGTRSVQLTGFAHAAPIGAPRTVCGTMPWQAPEQRHGRATGTVSDRDDLWAVGKLIYYMLKGEELDDLDKLREDAELSALLLGVFKAPEQRPAARELMRRLGASVPPVAVHGTDPAFERGRTAFHRQRAVKHPHLFRKAPEPEPVTLPPPRPSRWRRLLLRLGLGFALRRGLDERVLLTLAGLVVAFGVVALIVVSGL